MAHSEINKQGEIYDFSSSKEWGAAEAKINKYVDIRKLNYMGMILLSLILLFLIISTWTSHVDYWGRSGLAGHFADIVDYFTPTMFENLVELSIMHYPIYLLVSCAGVSIFWMYNKRMRQKTLEAAILIRDIVNKAVKN